MSRENLEELIALCNLDAVASREDTVRNYLFHTLKEAADEVLTDHIGSIIFHRKGNGPKLMMCAHMDEVGFLVQHISDEGMLFTVPLGGVSAYSQYMQKVRVSTSTGKIVKGVLMCSKVDEKGAQSTYVDLGYQNRGQVLEVGIQIGDMVSFATKAEWMNDSILCAKALDDRAGCFAVLKAFLSCKEEAPTCDFYAAFTTSEEVGLRGAKTASSLIQPDVCIAVDIGSTKDVHSNGYKNHRKLGDGPMLLHYDKGCIPTQKMTACLNQTAEKIGITLQQDMFLGGGTDIDSVNVFGQGVPGAVIGIPLHYAHGACSLVHKKDILEVSKLCEEIAKTWDKERVESFTDFLPKS